MGLIFSRRVGSDPYYANYEKSFERLEKECVKLTTSKVKRRQRIAAITRATFWLTVVTSALAAVAVAAVQRFGHQTFVDKAISILIAVALPACMHLFSRGVRWYLRLREARDERFIKKLIDSKRKMVKELKDSTRFEKTMALVRKYDPDEAARAAQTAAEELAKQSAAANVLRNRKGQPNQGAGAQGAAAPGSAAAARAPSPSSLQKGLDMAAGLTAGFGKSMLPAVLPVIDKLARAIGDNPALIEDLRRIQKRANEYAEEVERLQRENHELRQRLHELHDCPPTPLMVEGEAAPAPEEAGAEQAPEGKEGQEEEEAKSGGHAAAELQAVEEGEEKGKEKGKG